MYTKLGLMAETSTAAEIAAEIEILLRENPDVQTVARRVADQAAAYAKQIAPIYAEPRGESGGRHPGTFRDSIHAQDRAPIDGLPAAEVVSDDRAASYIEYGTGKTPEHAVFARTAEHFGGETAVSLWVGTPEALGEAFGE
jgi:hypothetical protein